MSELEKISETFIKIKNQISHINYSYDILNLWSNIVGEQFSKNTFPIKFDKGIIYVSVSSNVWLNQINFFKLEIIKKYNEYYKNQLIKDIKFLIKKNDNLNNNNNFPTKKINNNKEIKIKLEILKEEDRKYIDKCVAIIEDNNLRVKLENFFSIIRRRELTLIKKGWKRCKKCNILFNSNNDDYCKFCK
ncbi:MAG: hypothetical protein KatS3mg068_2105 [Candidatus Sericytochromatia bacterium]|nr:MAG: hypothetical protein KatS3mg068_2105 [Candidatus Sericytochromatia bacterium]